MIVHKPLLSIIIPLYNAEKTVVRCLNSIPSHKEIEIILIDDGSLDKTGNICDEYCGNDVRFRYFYQENRGPGAARNLGILESNGDYVMFLDSDDYINSIALGEILEDELTQKNDVIYYNFEQVNENGSTIKKFKLDRFNNCTKSELINYTLSWTLPWGQFKIIKKELINLTKNKFSETSNDSEELMFTISTLETAENIYFSDKDVYRYVKTHNSLSTSHKSFDLLKMRFKIFSELSDNYGDIYPKGVNNYKFASLMQIYKLFCEQWKGIKGFILYKEYLVKEMKICAHNVDVNYYSLRYKILHQLFMLKFSLLIFVVFKIMATRLSGNIK